MPPAVSPTSTMVEGAPWSAPTSKASVASGNARAASTTVTHGASPARFADVDTSGPARRARARATSDAGTRTAMVPAPARSSADS